MSKEYGSKQGKEVFYATMNKMKKEGKKVTWHKSK